MSDRADSALTEEAAIRAGLITSCREDLDDGRCDMPAEFVLWGKLFKPEHLGPRCYDHAVAHTATFMPSRADQWAVIDLRAIRRQVYRPEPTADGPCRDCGRGYPAWFAPHEVWNLVMGGPDATDDPGGLLCPTCFLIQADPVTSASVWHLSAPPTTTGTLTAVRERMDALAIDLAQQQDEANLYAAACDDLRTLIEPLSRPGTSKGGESDD